MKCQSQKFSIQANDFLARKTYQTYNLCDKFRNERHTHTLTCQRFKCNWSDTSFSNKSEIKSHSNQKHKGKNYITHGSLF